MAAYQQPPKDWFKLQELMMIYGAKLYEVTLGVKDKCRKGVAGQKKHKAISVVKVIYMVVLNGNFKEEKVVIGSELTGYLDYLLNDYRTGIINKPGESQSSSQVDDCDVSLPVNVSSDWRAEFEALHAVRPSEKEMFLRLKDAMAILEPMELHQYHWSLVTGKRKLDVVSINAMIGSFLYDLGRGVDGMKQTGHVHNGTGTAESESPETKERMASSSSKPNLGKEKDSSRSGCMHLRTCMNCGHQEPWLNTKSNDMYSKDGKHTGVEKELKATGHSDPQKNGQAKDEFKDIQELKATEESSSEKASKVTVDGPNFGKGRVSEKVKEYGPSGCKKDPTSTTCGLQEPCSKTESNAIYSKAGEETGVEKELKATEVSDCHVKNDDSAVGKKSGRKQTVDVDDGATAETESQGIKGHKASASNRLNLKQQPTTKTKSKVSNSQTGEEMGVKMELKSTKESDSIKKDNATEETSANKPVKANKKSSSERTAKATVDGPDMGKGKSIHEEKESSRPGNKSVRYCMTCGLQQPAPKVFKKCKRCKDEGCPDPPYYCGRDCQVLDWTVRHRLKHEESCTGDPTTP